MATRSLNKAFLIGNLTRDPELRYTPQGNAVCTFGLATNRSWTTEDGERKEDVEFHTIVIWNRLAEICAEYLAKGRQAYIEGRISTREWEGQDGVKRRSTEVVASEIIFLGGGGGAQTRGEDINLPGEQEDAGKDSKPEADQQQPEPEAEEPEETKEDKKKESPEKKEEGEEIPF